MLTQMRENVGSWIIKLLLGGIVVVFIFWGVGPEQKSPNTMVASVDGMPIGYMEYSRTYQNLVENMRRQLGDNFNEEMLQALNLKEQAVNQLVDRRVILKAADKMGFKVTDKELATSISTIPAFQADGTFNARVYQQVLSRMGMTPENFEASQREDLMIQKVSDFITRTVNVSDREAAAWYQWQNTAMDIEYLLVDPTRYDKVTVSEDELQAFFKTNQNRYKTDPQIKLRYVGFRTAEYKPRVQVEDDEIKRYYEENQAEFFSPETVEARHILVALDKDADAQTVEAARLKAVDIRARAVQGEDFGALAKQLSEGPSKDQGGYLGTFGRGRMVKPFEEAAFALQAGEISEPVRSDFGWHIIKVEQHNKAETLSLEASRDKIRGRLSDLKARALALEEAESAYDSSYGGDDLVVAAERFGVTLQTVGPLSRSDAVPGLRDSRKLIETAFSLDDMAISEVQDLGDGFYLIQTLEKYPSRIPALEEVQARVTQDLETEKQWQQAEAQANELLQDVRGGKSFAEAGSSKGIAPQTTGWFKRREAIPGIGSAPGVAAAAFRLTSDNPFPEAPVRGEKGVFVFRYVDQQIPDARSGEGQLDAILAQLRQRKQREVYGNWMAEARRQTEIEIDRSMLE
ncbi:MAG: SurA N-terminal domain-containing protein [Desulfobacterales bacterium]